MWSGGLLLVLLLQVSSVSIPGKLLLLLRLLLLLLLLLPLLLRLLLDELGMSQPVKVLDGQCPAEGLVPLELVVHFDVLVQIVSRQALVGDSLGDLLLLLSATRRQLRGRASHRLKLCEPSSFTRDDDPQSVWVIVRLFVTAASVLSMPIPLPLRCCSTTLLHKHSGPARLLGCT